MKRLRLIPAVALAFGVLASTTACATGYAYERRPVYRGADYRDIERRAFDEGFRDGVRAGESDARHNRRYEPQRHGDWRDADDGYRREYGDHNRYRSAYRNGFESGYSQSFRRNDGRGRRW